MQSAGIVVLDSNAQIIVISVCIVAENGTHDDLMAKNGIYAELHRTSLTLPLPHPVVIIVTGKTRKYTEFRIVDGRSLKSDRSLPDALGEL